MYITYVKQNEIKSEIYNKILWVSNIKSYLYCFIQNPVRSCDTTIYGVSTELLRTWVSGVDEFNGSNGFRIAQNYPNPFAGLTIFTIKLQDKKDITITLVDICVLKHQVIGGRVSAIKPPHQEIPMQE